MTKHSTCNSYVARHFRRIQLEQWFSTCTAQELLKGLREFTVSHEVLLFQPGFGFIIVAAVRQAIFETSECSDENNTNTLTAITEFTTACRGAFAKLPKASISFVMYLSTSTGRVFMKFDIWVPYFSIDNAHTKLFRQSFWCIDNAHYVFSMDNAHDANYR